jgi:hypothetical protein
MVTKGPLPVATNSTDGWVSTLQKRRPVSRDFNLIGFSDRSIARPYRHHFRNGRNRIRMFRSGTQPDRAPAPVNQPISIAPIGVAYVCFFESVDLFLKSQHETALLIRGAIPSFIGGHNL